MRVWVDCTAAAHPLVLRPLIERLEAQGHEVFITAREYGQTVGILERLGLPYTVVGEHGGASRLGKGGRWPGARRGSRGWSGTAAAAGDRARLGRPRRRRRLFRIPSVQMQDYEFAGCSGRSPSAWRGGCWSRTRSRSTAWPARRQGAEAGPLSRA